MKQQFSFIISVCLAWMTWSQSVQNIKGVVLDKDTEFPLAGAEVYVTKDGKTYGAVADIDGKYVIKDVPLGVFSINARHIGYKSVGYDNLFLDAGKETVINFYLEQSVDKLDEVVVSVKKKSDQTAFAVASSYEMNADQINRYAGSLGDVARMTMNYAGVSSNDDTRNDIIVRGNNPNSLLWMMEGVPIPNPNHYSSSGSSGGPVSMINANLLGKADFLAGAFPANFGNTTAAAFNLHFRTPNNDKYEYLGQIGFAGVELGVEGYLKKQQSSFMADYRYSTLDFFDKIGIDFGTGTAVPRYQDATVLFHIPTPKSGTFRIWAIAGESRIRFLTEEDSDDNLYLDYEHSDLRTYNFTLISGINHKYFFNSKTSWFNSVSFSHLDQQARIDTLNVLSGQYDNFFTGKIFTDYLTFKTELKTKINPRNTLASGAEHTRMFLDLFNEVNKPGLHHVNSVKEEVALSSVYLNWKHKFSDRLTVNSGLRIQYFHLNKQVSPEPRLGLRYNAGPKTLLSLAYGLHSNMQPLPAYFSMYEGIDPVYAEQRNTKVEFTRSHHLVAGIEQRLGQRLNGKMEIYYQKLFDVPVYHEPDSTYSVINSGYLSPGGSQIYYYPLFNEGEGKNYGIDLTLEYPLNEGFYMLLTGSIYQSLYKPADGKWYNTAWNGGFMSSLLAGKSFVFNSGNALGIDLNVNYSGGRRYTPIDKQASQLAGEAVYDKDRVFACRLPHYFRADIKFSYKLQGKKITQEWQLDLRNVFNRKNVFSQRYNKHTNEIYYTYQTGFFPVMQYRILF